MRESEAYVWIGVLIFMPIIALIWHRFLTPLILGEPLDFPAHQTTLRDDSAASGDADGNTGSETFEK